MRKDIDGFLNELTELSLKYQIGIAGCGCCGSPYLTECGSNDGDIDGYQYDELTWTEQGYIIKNAYPTPDMDEEVGA